MPPCRRSSASITRGWPSRWKPALTTSASTLDEVANHFYAAGPRYAAKGVEYCLQAADAAAAGYDFRRAKNYLAMAAGCAEFSGDGPRVDAAAHVVACQEAQVTSQGQQREEAAKAQLEYLGEHPDAPARLVLAVAELCYEVGHRSHNRTPWYAEAQRLCQRIVADRRSAEEEAQARHIMGTSLPPDQRAERIAELRKAHELSADAKAEDREASRWFAQIVNSLAKELGKGTAEERAEAKRLFEYRLRLEQQRRLGDPRGVATALAGLGRLAWYGRPKDTAGAEKHFPREPGNFRSHRRPGRAGQDAQPAWRLRAGAQRPRTGRWRTTSGPWQLAADPLDRCYAGVGLLQCYRRQGHDGQFEATATELVALLDGMNEKLPPELRSALARGAHCPRRTPASPAVKELLGRV